MLALLWFSWVWFWGFGRAFIWMIGRLRFWFESRYFANLVILCCLFACVMDCAFSGCALRCLLLLFGSYWI